MIASKAASYNSCISKLLKQAEALNHNHILVPGVQTWFNNNKIYFNNTENGKKGAILLENNSNKFLHPRCLQRQMMMTTTSAMETAENSAKNLKILLDDSLHMPGDNLRMINLNESMNLKDVIEKVRVL